MDIDNEPSGSISSIFVMPGSALNALRNEMLLSLGDNEAEEMLERYGTRCGEAIIKDMGIKCDDQESLLSTLESLMAELGLGRPVLEKVTMDEVVVLLEDSVEAERVRSASKPGCHFTRGYLSGMLSAMAGKPYRSVEEACISMGDDKCKHRLSLDKAKKLPSPEKEGSKEFVHPLKPGKGYLLKEDKPEIAYEIFTEYVNNGFFGFCISREFPDDIREKYGLEKTDIIWLTGSDDKEGMISPEKVSLLYDKCSRFLDNTEHGKAILMLSGVEYLTTHNPANTILKIVQLLCDDVAVNKALLLVPVSPETLEERYLKLMERELEIYEPPANKNSLHSIISS